MFRSRTWVGLVLSAGLLAGGCASTPKELRDPRDPLEPYNRAVYRFNTDFDKAFVQPAARAYRWIAPDVVDRGITNFFDNIEDATSFVNNVLQFKMSRAGSDVGRIFINSTVGVLGFFDVATNVGLPSYKEDFDQTLGYWGLEPGAYFVLPLLGPSSIRGTFGWAGDIAVDPFFSLPQDEIYWGAVSLRFVDRRADLLDATAIIEDAAVDPYVFVREAYFQRRRNLVYDGNPPSDEDDIWKDVDFGPAADTPADGSPP